MVHQSRNQNNTLPSIFGLLPSFSSFDFKRDLGNESTHETNEQTYDFSPHYFVFLSYYLLLPVTIIFEAANLIVRTNVLH